MTWTSLWYGVVWVVIGMLCTLFAVRRGLYLAIILPIIVGAFLHGFLLLVQAQEPNFQFFRFGKELSDWLNFLLIPLFASIVGGLLGELISPSEEE